MPSCLKHVNVHPLWSLGEDSICGQYQLAAQSLVPVLWSTIAIDLDPLYGTSGLVYDF